MKKLALFSFILFTVYSGACFAQELTKTQKEAMNALIKGINDDFLAMNKLYENKFLPRYQESLHYVLYSPDQRSIFYGIPERPDKYPPDIISQQPDHVSVSYFSMDDKKGLKRDPTCSPAECLFPEFNAQICLSIQMDSDSIHAWEIVKVREIVVDNCNKFRKLLGK